MADFIPGIDNIVRRKGPVKHPACGWKGTVKFVDLVKGSALVQWTHDAAGLSLLRPPAPLQKATWCEFRFIESC